MAEVGIGQLAQRGAGFWPHDSHNCISRGHIIDDDCFLVFDVAFEPVDISGLACHTGNDHKLTVVYSRNRDIGLNAASFVQPLGIHHFAGSDGNIVAAYPVQKRFSVRSFHLVFGKRALIHDANPITNGFMFGSIIVEPVLAAVGILVFGFLSLVGEPVGPFPAIFHTKHSAQFFEL